MLEVEMKFRLVDVATFEDRLAAAGAPASTAHHEEDHYFNAPDRDFACTDEALRLRRIGAANLLTYKGPKLDAQTKTRTEIEVAVADGDEAAADFSDLLVHLGYRPVAVVRKRRHIYRLEVDGFPLEVCLDEVEELGRFAELEILAPEDRLEPARAALLKMAARLGLAGSERRSYLELLFASREKRS
ncbi:MAG TPA: class IV adenylate cyclase [Gemmataceae bacterium]|jgi:adenylate cyclase class 2|nr:class IV adenylate cyclase [Gemmataceae bacterium]